MVAHILKHLGIPLCEVAENVVIAIDVESSSAAFAQDCTWPILPKYEFTIGKLSQIHCMKETF